MITELVNKLKDLYVDPELDMLCGVDGECRQVIKESAQVIEELSAKLQSANMERSSQYYNGGWIPCGERLPEEAGVYLVSMNRLGYPQREVDGFVCGKWERFGNDVIAWCKIPEPYKAESDKESEKCPFVE